MKMKLAALTSNRADYGLLRYLLLKLESHESIELSVLATGSHFKQSLGYSIQEVLEDSYERLVEVDLEIGDSNPADVSNQTSLAVSKFSDLFSRENFDGLIVLGDRFEVLAVCLAATIQGIPIIHIHGGDETIGALDNQFRHAITKLSHLHFPVTHLSASRIIQMGEKPENVKVIGSPFLDRIREEEILEYDQFVKKYCPALQRDYCLCTIHPETNSIFTIQDLVDLCIHTVLENSTLQLLISKANNDTNGREINLAVSSLQSKYPDRIIHVSSLGFQGYLCAIKYARFLIGNSSSGIMEAGLLGTPSIDVGFRQEGRECSEFTIRVQDSKKDLIEALDRFTSSMPIDLKESPYYQSSSPAQVMLDKILSIDNLSQLKRKRFVLLERP